MTHPGTTGWPRATLPLIAFVGSAAAIHLVCLLIVQSSRFADRPDALALGMTLDMTVIVPSIYYLLVVRRGGVAWITTIPVFVVSSYLAASVLPADRQLYLDGIRALLAPAELVLLGLVAWKVRALVRGVRATRDEHRDIGEAIAVAMRGAIGSSRVAHVLASEAAMLYYAVFGWGRVSVPAGRGAVFPYHRVNGWPAVLVVVQGMIVVETLGLHFLLQMWSPIAAWTATALSVYSMVWLLGDYLAMRRRPMRIEDGRLEVRLGLRWSADIPLESIESVSGDPAPDKTRRCSLNAVAFGQPQLELRLRDAVVAKGFFGLRKRCDRVLIAVEDPERFRRALTPIQPVLP
jgi:hypothetical protein